VHSPKPGPVAADQLIPVRVAVDGAAVATSPSDTEGDHEIKIEYVDDHHASYDPPIVAATRVRATS
jgi:hypothetical protein